MTVMTTAEYAPTLPAPTAAELRAMTTLTLSDLIRAGASITGQARNCWGQADHACTISAAAIALADLDRK